MKKRGLLDKKNKILCSSLLCMLMNIFPINAPTASESKPVPTVTLLVKQYGELEIELQQAIKINDTKKINQLIANDFEAYNSNNQPISQSTWLRLSRENTNTRIEKVIVREFNDLRIVSFLLTSANKSRPNATFIVDVWKENAKRTLKARYLVLLRR